ncbi:MAG TPA: hypothetical protein VNX66_00300 [Candidatus Sulfotelmatobacter sp.]|nr:hypothetical protein [Candidatus Sulfotelmatobacter sp.]
MTSSRDTSCGDFSLLDMRRGPYLVGYDSVYVLTKLRVTLGVPKEIHHPTHDSLVHASVACNRFAP